MFNQPARILKVKAAAALLAVFMVGGGIGYLAGHRYVIGGPWFGPRDLWRVRAAGPVDPGAMLLRRLESDLKLSPSQCTRVGEILRRHHQRLVQIRRELTPRVDTVLDGIRQELRSIMNPRQRESFDEMVQSRIKRRRDQQERKQDPRR